MKIQNNNINQTPFNGYDARPLKGFLMNSNYAHIADEMRNIGEIENFKIFLFQKSGNNFELATDKFELTPHNKGCWAQDYFGIVKNTLLAFEPGEKSNLIQKIFNLTPNKIQLKVQNEQGLSEQQNIVDFLYSLPKVQDFNGQEITLLPRKDGLGFIPWGKEFFDTEFKLQTKILEKIGQQTHIKGGNYFITKGNCGEDEVLIGENELKKFSIKQLQEMFQTDKVHVIPQADYHIDLFIRPLRDKKVLIADDELMVKTLKDGFNKVTEYIKTLPRNKLDKYKNTYIQTGIFAQEVPKIMRHNPMAGTKQVEDSLLKAGFEPIRVPGRIYELELFDDNHNKIILKHMHNYLNANVLVNDKNELVYITNKSNIDDRLCLTPTIIEKTGFSLEKAFKEAVAPYVDKLYFVGGDNNAIANELLPECYGGIHCMNMEIPKNL